MSIVVPLVIALIGALVYGFSANGKVVEIGRICFMVGLFFVVANLADVQLVVR